MGDQKLPAGVRIIGDQLQINFRLDGVRYFKAVPGVTKVNKNSITYADNKRRVIKIEIKEKRFSWLNHFPDSPEAALEAGLQTETPTVTTVVNDWLDVNELRLAKSTITNYRKHALRITRFFEGMLAKDVRKSDVLKFQSHIVSEKNFTNEKPLPIKKQRLGLSIKTCNETFIVLRGAMTDAYFDELVPYNVFERVENLKHVPDNEPDPFLEQEVAAIEALLDKHHRPQDIILILANCWMGLSISELMALAWEDVDFLNRKVIVRRSCVDGHFKVPKEKSREREFNLLDPAMSYLMMMKSHTFLQQPVKIKVTNRDNIKSKTVEIRLVFKNITAQNEHGRWDITTIARQMNHVLDKAGVRRRGINQTRHTFASRMLTQLVPEELIAQIMGHTSTAMLKKHYGKIIRSEQPNSARIISHILGIEYTEPKSNEEKQA